MKEPFTLFWEWVIWFFDVKILNAFGIAGALYLNFFGVSRGAKRLSRSIWAIHEGVAIEKYKAVFCSQWTIPFFFFSFFKKTTMIVKDIGFKYQVQPLTGCKNTWIQYL